MKVMKMMLLLILFSFIIVSSCSAFSASNPDLREVGTSKNVATQVLQGVGAPQIDLNFYNVVQNKGIDISTDAELFNKVQSLLTANFVERIDEKDVMVELASTDEAFYVDTTMVEIPLTAKSSSSLGLELSEIAGDRKDGLGITIITNVVPGGNSDGLDIFPGDSLKKITFVRRKLQTKLNSETQEQFEANMECLDYESTVRAIQSLPAPMITNTDDDNKKGRKNNNVGFEEFFRVQLKRLRRKPKVKVNLQYPPSQNQKDETIEMYAGENLRYGMLIRGVKLNDPLALRFDTKSGGNCGAGGLCRTCAVSIGNGKELLNPQRPAEKQMLQDNPRFRLSCKAIVGFGMQEGTLNIKVNPRQWDE